MTNRKNFKNLIKTIMKKLLLIFFLFIPQLIIAQGFNPDSLKLALKTAATDSAQFTINFALEDYYEEVNVDSALYYADKSLQIAERNNQKLAEGAALAGKGYSLTNISKYGESLKYLTNAFQILENPESENHSTWLTAYSGSHILSPHYNRLWILSIAHHMYALLMDATLNYKEEIFHFNEEKRISEMCGRNAGEQFAYMNLSRIYTDFNKLDSALIYAKKTLSLSEKNKITLFTGWAYDFMGNIYYKMKKYDPAQKSYFAGISASIAEKDLGALEENYKDLTELYLDIKNRDSSLFYAKKTLSVTNKLGNTGDIKYYLAFTYENLYQAYKLNNQPDIAYKYLQLAMAAKNADYKIQIENLAHFQNVTLSHEKHLQDLENEKIETQNKIRLYSLIAALAVFIIIALLLYRNSRSRKKANQLLQKQNEIIHSENERRAAELEEARQLQLSMLPESVPKFPDLDVAVYMQTATEVGGDYYDFSSHIDGSFNIAIGDATGHGMKAGTLVTMMKSLFTVNSAKSSIEEFFNSSNAAIKNSNLKRMMAGFAMLNITDHKAKLINAGMPPVYHYKKNESRVEELKLHSLPLGAMAMEKYNSMEINLNSGDKIIMMSDGYPELHNQSDELFGYEKVLSTIQNNAEKEPEELIKFLNDEGAGWREDKELLDDVTFVVVKVK